MTLYVVKEYEKAREYFIKALEIDPDFALAHARLGTVYANLREWDKAVYHKTRAGGDVDHNLLTSLVDRRGVLRVQYMGERFDPTEFLHELCSKLVYG